jgi:cytochrome c-type biogenesis protein CcmE
MSARFQRLLIIILSLSFFIVAVLLILFNSKDNLIFFYTPSELLDSNIKLDDTVRVGGYVQKNSLKIKNGNQYNFIITDNKNSINIYYSGLLPDLFREEQGVVIEGKFEKNNYIKASTVFAKHDENYLPTSIKKQLEKNDSWKKEYK